MEFTGYCMDDTLPRIALELFAKGRTVERRGGSVKEFREPVMITLREPRLSITTLPERKLNPWVTLCEFPWLMAGRNDIAWVGRYLPRAADFSDDGQTWRAGYGPRLRRQLPRVIEELRRNPDTRQAVITLWDPPTEWGAIETGTKDVPCTNWLHFQIREGMLDLLVGMRSNDLIWGFSGVNVVNFTLLQRLVAESLGWVGVGRYTHVASNLHCYERHWGMLEVLAKSPRAEPVRYQEPPLLAPGQPVTDFMHECELHIRELMRGSRYSGASPWLNLWSLFMDERRDELRLKHALIYPSSWVCTGQRILSRNQAVPTGGL